MPDPLQYLNLCHHHAHRWSRLTGLPYDDLQSAAYLGLCRAVRFFDPSRSVPFVAYASMCIECSCKTEAKTLNLWNHSKVSLISTNEEGEETEADIEDLYASMPQAWVSNLSHKEETALRLTLCGYNNREVGERLGVKCERARRILAKVKEQIAEAI